MSMIEKLLAAPTFNEYQHEARETADYPSMDDNLLYPALGLAGEAGETVDKIKKLWRNQGKTKGRELTKEELVDLQKELGDVLWYVAALASELGLTMSGIAAVNLQKLRDRQVRGVIKSQGDNR